MDHATDNPPEYSEDIQQTFTRELAGSISDKLNNFYQQDMGFFLVIATKTGGEDRANYMSNVARGTGIEWLRETADRLEANEVKAVHHG